MWTLLREPNVVLDISEIRRRSPILEELGKKGSIKIVGAMYVLATGMVEFCRLIRAPLLQVQGMNLGCNSRSLFVVTAKVRERGCCEEVGTHDVAVARRGRDRVFSDQRSPFRTRRGICIKGSGRPKRLTHHLGASVLVAQWRERQSGSRGENDSRER
jgi:hypothetical protein